MNADYVAPQTELEQTIASIWQKLLKVEQVGIHDNFFELGGNSLLATQVISHLRKTFQVELSIRRFFENPTVADQALAVQQSQGKEENNSINKIERIDRGDANQLLENLDLISEQEVDAFLSEMLAEGEFER